VVTNKIDYRERGREREDNSRGAVVTKIYPNSPAERSGIQVGGELGLELGLELKLESGLELELGLGLVGLYSRVRVNTLQQSSLGFNLVVSVRKSPTPTLRAILDMLLDCDGINISDTLSNHSYP
jgi:S1-C subfamily serine protease